jgi:predicted GIY-YIG superfamily endonuclease
MKETYIYKISDELGNTRYIGKSNNPRRRLYQHIKDKSNLHLKLIGYERTYDDRNKLQYKIYIN